MRAAQIVDLSGSYGTIDNGAIWAKVTNYQLDRLYGTAMVFRDGQMVNDMQALSSATLKHVHDKGIEYGIVRVPQWTNLSAAGLAQQLSKDLTMLGAVAGVQCAAMANAEAHDFDIVGFLQAFRKPRPFREVGWGIEGMQGGRLNAAARRAITMDINLVVYAEVYRGNMYPQAQDAVRDDLRSSPDGYAYDLGSSRAKLYYDGLNGAPDHMDGVIYTMERLP